MPANDASAVPAISADGRFVAFESDASNLVVGDTNECTNSRGESYSCRDIFVRDRSKRTIERVSVSSGGAQPNSDSYDAAISADGRFIAFDSKASNLVAGDRKRSFDVFVRDRLKRTTERVSVSSGGAPGDDGSGHAAISADGRFVAFESWASNLVAGDTNATSDVFVRDRLRRTTERVSVSSSGGPANGYSDHAAISADGRFVAFQSEASNLVAGDTSDCPDSKGKSSNCEDVFVRDRLRGTTERVSIDSSGAEADDMNEEPVISAGGRFVAFTSRASNLVAGDTNRCAYSGSRDNCADVFVRDRLKGTTERVSISSSGAQARDADPYSYGSYSPAISADGRYVAFQSAATNLVARDTNGKIDLFAHDRLKGTTERVSISSEGAQANGYNGDAAISADGRFVAFDSDGSKLVAGDTNRRADVFVRDRLKGTTELVSVGRALPPQAGPLLRRPWPARAGRRLITEMLVSAGQDRVSTARVACTATLGGRKLSASGHNLEHGFARCTWQIPANARGKRITGSISATTAGGTATQRFAGTVH